MDDSGNESRSNRDLKAASSGDDAALSRLLMAESLRLSQRLAAKMKAFPQLDITSDDVLQEVFVDAFRGYHTFDPAHPAGFRGWITKVADHRLATVFRDRGRKKRGGDFRRAGPVKADPAASSVVQLVQLLSGGGGTPSQHFVKDELVSALRVGIASLPDDQRTVVQLYYLEDHDLESTAQSISKSSSAVRGLLHRAKKNLREILGQVASGRR